MFLCRFQIFCAWTFHDDGVKIVLKNNDLFADELNFF